MGKEYDYRCPDCGKTVEFRDKFCKECGCKLNWEDEENKTEDRKEELKAEKDNKTKDKPKNKRKNKKNAKKNRENNKNNIIRISFILITLQMFLIIIGLFTNNVSFIINSGKDIPILIGENIFLVLGIFLLIKNKRDIKSNLKNNILLIVISCIMLIAIIILASFKTNNDGKNVDNDIIIDCFYILTNDYTIAQQAINELKDCSDIDKVINVINKYNGNTMQEKCSSDYIIDEFKKEYEKLEAFEYTQKPIETEYGYYVIYRKSKYILSKTGKKALEEFNDFIKQQESISKEIWIFSGNTPEEETNNRYDLFEEIIITDKAVYNCFRVGDSCEIYEIKMNRNGNEVYIGYYYGNKLIEDKGSIINNKLIYNGGTYYRK